MKILTNEYHEVVYHQHGVLPPKYGRAASLIMNLGLFFFSIQGTELFVPFFAVLRIHGLS